MKIVTVDDIKKLRSITNEHFYDELIEGTLSFNQAINGLENYTLQMMQDHYHSRPELYELNNKIIKDSYKIFFDQFKLLSSDQRLALHKLAGTCRNQIAQMDDIRLTESENSGRVGIPTLVRSFILASLNASMTEFGSYEPFRIYYIDFLKNRYNFDLKKELFPNFVFFEIEGAAYFPSVPVARQEDTGWARRLKQTLRRGLSPSFGGLVKT